MGIFSKRINNDRRRRRDAGRPDLHAGSTSSCTWAGSSSPAPTCSRTRPPTRCSASSRPRSARSGALLNFAVAYVVVGDDRGAARRHPGPRRERSASRAAPARRRPATEARERAAPSRGPPLPYRRPPCSRGGAARANRQEPPMTPEPVAASSSSVHPYDRLAARRARRARRAPSRRATSRRASRSTAPATARRALRDPARRGRDHRHRAATRSRCSGPRNTFGERGLMRDGFAATTATRRRARAPAAAAGRRFPRPARRPRPASAASSTALARARRRPAADLTTSRVERPDGAPTRDLRARHADLQDAARPDARRATSRASA